MSIYYIILPYVIIYYHDNQENKKPPNTWYALSMTSCTKVDGTCWWLAGKATEVTAVIALLFFCRAAFVSSPRAAMLLRYTTVELMKSLDWKFPTGAGTIILFSLLWGPRACSLFLWVEVFVTLLEKGWKRALGFTCLASNKRNQTWSSLFKKKGMAVLQHLTTMVSACTTS